MTAVRYAVLISPAATRRHWRLVAMTWDDLIEFAAGKPGSRKDSGAYVPGKFETSTVQHTKWTHDADGGSRCRHPMGERGTCGARLVPDGDPCTGWHRRKEACVSRSMLTLDADTDVRPDLVEAVRALGLRALVHTTWSHRQPGKGLRFRVVIPMDAGCTYEEHWRIAETVMRVLGWDQFDPSCRQAERVMFRASTQDPDTYERHVFDGPVLSAAEWLARADAEGIAAPLPRVWDAAEHLTDAEAAATPAAPWQAALARTALLAAAERVREAAEGTRRTSLWSGLTEAYGYVLGGCLTVDEVNTAMTDAADEAGVGEWFGQQSEGAWVRARANGPIRPMDGFDALESDEDDEPEPERQATAEEWETLRRLNRAVMARPVYERAGMLRWALRKARTEGIPDTAIREGFAVTRKIIGGATQ